MLDLSYPYKLVEAQTREPLSKRTFTHSGRLCLAARCNGVAPLSSLIFTNLAYPLKSIIFDLKKMHTDGKKKTNQVKETHQ